MNKSEIVMELSDLRSDVDFDYSIPKPAKKAIVNRIGEIIIDLLLLDDDKPNCSNCPAMRKVDNLADAIDQAVLISRETRTPFKVSYLRSEVDG